VIGAPIAGAVFGLEVSPPFRLRPLEWLQSAVASTIAFAVSQLLGGHHAAYPHLAEGAFTWRMLPGLLMVSVLFGIAVRIFVAVTHAVQFFFSKN